MLTHPLTNFEIQKPYENEPRFNGVYSLENLPNKIKDGAYVRNFDEHTDIGTHQIALYSKSNAKTYFDSLVVENVPKEIKNFIGNKVIIENIQRIQTQNSVMCGCFLYWISLFYV